MYRIADILTYIHASKSKLTYPHSEIITLAYDSRKVINAASSLFFALRQQRDGHQYIADAYRQGVRNFVISDLNFDISNFEEANFIWVEDTMVSMQQLSAQHRSLFTYPVLAITGSNGKTIVKEWLHQLLSIDKNCYQSPKSYNSQLGVALSLWNMSSEYNIALIEAGISKIGEMERLAEMIKPTIGIFTSLGTAHREGFASKEEKLAEKWRLYDEVEKIFAPSSYLSEQYLKDTRIISWGNNSSDKLEVLDVSKSLFETTISLRYVLLETTLRIPFVDKASVENVLTCVLTLLEFGYDFEWIQTHVLELKPLEMRLKLKRGKQDSTLIDDTYSNDLASLQIALDFLAQQNQHQRRVLVLSDFEGEEYTAKFEKKLVEILNHQELDQLILVGDKLGFLASHIHIPISFYKDTSLLMEHLHKLDWKDSSVLIKGARRFCLEKVSNALEEKSHDTVLEINLKSIEHNLNQYRSKLKEGVKVMAMVKAFSYGSGSFEVANLLQFNKVDYLTVAFVDEGVELRRTGVSLSIMVMSPHEGTFEDLVYYKLEPEIYSLRILKSFASFIESKGLKAYPIHIKLDTGMHRLGFMPDEMDEMIDFISKSNTLRVQSAFSHLVGAGDPSLLDFTQKQISLFKTMSNQLESQIGYNIIKHICNTSGVLHHPEAHFDMVRIGIGLYGYDMAPKNVSLEQVGVLKTTISQIKHLPSTDTVGYDRKGVLHRDSVIATVKIGYADGYNRRLGNGVGKMLINGKLVPTIGNVCMDMCMLDITDIVANEGDQVVVFPDVAHIAKEIGTIPYELLTGISSRVKRVYFYE